MSLLCFAPTASELWSVDHILMYENSELKVLRNIILSGETFSNWPNDSLGINVFKTLESCCNNCWLY